MHGGAPLGFLLGADAFVSGFVIGVVDVLVTDGAGLGVVDDHVFLSRTKIGVVLHIKLSDLQSVLLTLNIHRPIDGMDLSRVHCNED